MATSLIVFVVWVMTTILEYLSQQIGLVTLIRECYNSRYICGFSLKKEQKMREIKTIEKIIENF